MFTRNLGAAGGGKTLLDITAFDETARPFGNAMGVIVTYGGAVRTVNKKDALRDLQGEFNPTRAKNPFVRP